MPPRPKYCFPIRPVEECRVALMTDYTLVIEIQSMESLNFLYVAQVLTCLNRVITEGVCS